MENLLAEKVDINRFDAEGFSAMAYLFKGKQLATLTLYTSATSVYDPIFKMLVDAGGNPALSFPESEFKPDGGPEPYMSCAAINLLRQQSNDTIAKDGLMALFQCGCSFAQGDSDGKDVLHYAIS